MPVSLLHQVFHEVAKHEPLTIKLDLNLSSAFTWSALMCACKTRGSRRMELFGDVKECHVWLQLSSIPESIPAGHESVNGSQCF